MEEHNSKYVNITSENLAEEQLCCIIRTRKIHNGVEAKRKWLLQRLEEGHIFRKLDGNATCFIEFAPLESAWVPITGENYIYIYCLWVCGDVKGTGCGRELMEYCIETAKAHGRSGVCMLGAKKQKAWLSDRNFAEKYGFIPVDSTDYGYELLALSSDGTYPRFSDSVRTPVAGDGVTLYYDMQCPFIPEKVESIRKYCGDEGIPATFILVDSLQKAKTLPCVFNNWALFYNGKFETVNICDASFIERLKKATDRKKVL